MRLVFAGTPGFAAVALQALIASRHEIVLVLTQPDRPAGRGMTQTISEVKALARGHGLELFQPPTLKDETALARLRASGADAMVVVAYGKILPQAVLDLFVRGCINVHASLLPRWRGAAPIQRALLAGDSETGVCIMRMDAGLDTGPVYLSERVAISSRDTAGTLHDRLAALGARLLIRTLEDIEAGRIEPRPQAALGATYAPRIANEEAIIDWSCAAQSIERLIRAFNPVPGAQTTLNGERIKIWSAQLASLPAGATGGQIVSLDERGIVVACGTDALAISELQRAGGRRLRAQEFLRGHRLAPGMRLGA
ncbi:MAG TPA: methionyl-tRNA formyltransferase [Burkholderiales bacterium]|nr:methionyl-tRNA formyltransferase [Burkholderiales bacterium]